jgi:DNA-binding XRE family transcriptional regulator
MWFHKEKLAQAAKSNNLKWAWLSRRLGCSGTTLYEIMHGKRAANYRIAKSILEVFGYDAVVNAIDWGRTSYAG